MEAEDAGEVEGWVAFFGVVVGEGDGHCGGWRDGRLLGSKMAGMFRGGEGSVVDFAMTCLSRQTALNEALIRELTLGSRAGIDA